jgi:hypothetical protein
MVINALLSLLGGTVGHLFIGVVRGLVKYLNDPLTAQFTLSV